MLSLGNKLTLTTQPIYKFVNKYSIDFDGVDDRIITDGADTVLQNTTYSFWCKSSTTTANSGVFGHGGINTGAFHFNWEHSGVLKPFLYLGGSYYVFWDRTTAQDDGDWHHWVVYSEPNNLSNCKLYVDGVLQNTSLTVTSGSLNAYTESLTIGSDQAVGGNSFEGKIDEFAVYDRELTQAEITRMYNTYYSPNRVANGNFAQIGNEEVTNGDFSQIGSEQVTNGDFATDSGWSFYNANADTNTRFENNSAILEVFNTRFTRFISTTSPMTLDKFYKITYEVTETDNTDLKIQYPSTSLNSSIGTHTVYIKATNVNIGFSKTNVGKITIDNVSVKEVGQDWTFGTGWSTDGTKAIFDDSANSGVSQSVSFNTGSSYKITFDIVSGSPSLAFLSSNGATTYVTYSSYAVGTHSVTFDYTTGTGFMAYGSSILGGAFEIDNISVKEVGQHWTFGTGWSMGDGVANATDAAFNSQLTDSTTLVAGKEYKISFNVSNYVKGNVNVTVGNVSSSTVSANGSYTFNLTTSLTTPFRVSTYAGGSGTTLSVDNIVVQELKHDATNLMLNAGAYQSANPLITSTKSMEFDGTDDYLQLGEPFSHTNHTITGWFKLDVISGITTIFDSRDSADDGLIAYIDGTGRFLYRIGDGTQSTINSSALDVNKWYNFACSYDGTTQTIYLNGVDVVNTTVTKSISTTTNATIGKVSYTNALYFDGNITEVGAYNRALTSLEVASLYNQGMPTDLLVNRNNYQSGNPTVFNTKQIDFDGVDDVLNIGNPSVLNFTSDFTISMWIRSNVNTDSYNGLFTKYGYSAGWDLILSAGKVRMGLRGTSAIDTGGGSGSDLRDGNWHHIVAVNTNSDIKLYLDGVLIQTQTGTWTPTTTTNDALIGERGGIPNFDGDISQVGAWTGTLTADEVSSLYNHGLPIDLTTDQAAYESSSNLVGYWRMGSGTLDTYPLIADQTNATLGSEEFVNGSFTGVANGTDVTTLTNWNTYGSPTSRNVVDNKLVIVATGGNQGAFYTLSSLSAGTYKLSVDVSGDVGAGAIYITGANTYNVATSVGNVEFYFVGLGNTNIFFRAGSNSAGTTSYTNISIKKVNGNPAIMTNQTSSDIENGSPYANIVQNGDFSEGTTDWTSGTTVTSFTVTNSIATVLGTASSAQNKIQQSIPVTIGNTYKISGSIRSNDSKDYRIRILDSAYVDIKNNNNSSFETFEYERVAQSSSILLIFESWYSDGTANFSVDYATIEEVNTGLQGYWKMGDGTNDEYPVIYDQVDPTLGSELVTNGDFATDSDWTKGIGWSIANGKATTDGTINTDIEQNCTETGKTYYYSVTYFASGTFSSRIRSGSSGAIINIQEAGTYNGYFIANGVEFEIVTLSDNTISYSIDNVSVKEVQGNPATMTNMVEGNITKQYPLTKIRNYYRMGDGILDGYPIIQDQTSPNLAHIPTTNLLPYSEDFSQWTALDCSITSGFTAPDGSNTAYKVSDNGAPNGLLYYSGVSAADQARTIYARTVSGTGTAQLTSHNANTNNIFNLTEDWQRFEVNTTTNVATIFYAIDFRGSGTLSEVLLWGAQTEEQSQATAYIKSDGIAAVRKSSTTNLIPYSEDFTDISWGISEAEFVLSTITSPLDSSYAYKLQTLNNSNQSYAQVTVTTVATKRYTFSVYVKKADYNYVALVGLNPLTVNYFDLVNGITNGGSTTSLTYTNIEDAGNGWFRCSVTFIADTTSKFAGIYLSENGTSISLGGVADGKGVYIWGAQLEEQTQAETYAKTTGLPVTIDLFTENNYGTMTNMSSSDIVEDTP